MARPSPSRQDLIWRIEAAAFDVVSAVLRLLPVDLVSAAGAAVAKAVGPLTRAQRVVDRNLALAFPEMSAAERAAISRAQWDNIGRTFFEFPLTDRLTPASGRVEVVGGERLAAVAASGRPAVIVTGHFADWEVTVATMVAAGLPLLITYRATNNPYVDRRIRAVRARYGVKGFAPKGGEGARDVLAALDRGETVALMADQKFNEGIAVPFFGHPAHTATGPARLALRARAPIIPMSVERTGGARFRVVVHEPIELETGGDRAQDVAAGTARITAFVESCVRARPGEWFWVHRRWPAALYRGEA